MNSSEIACSDGVRRLAPAWEKVDGGGDQQDDRDVADVLDHCPEAYARTGSCSALSGAAGASLRAPASRRGAGESSAVRPRTGSRRRSGCGRTASPATRARASGAACGRTRRPSGRRGPSCSPTPAGRCPRARARARRRRQAGGGARTPCGTATPGVSPTYASKRSGRIVSSPATIVASSSGASPARRRRSTAWIRATSSSGWHGFVSQSSAPPRSARTRSATGAGPLTASTASPGNAHRDPLDVFEPRQRRVDDQRVQPQRGQLVGAGGVAENLPFPPERGEPPLEYREQPAVVIDQRDADRRRDIRR